MSYKGESFCRSRRREYHIGKGSDAMDQREMAFDRCYRKHYSAVLCFGISRGQSRADAEEIAAEAFVRLWNRWDEMADSDDISIKKWLYVTAGHIVREYRRRQAPDIPLEELECVLTDPEGNTPLEEEQFRHYLKKIRRELSESEWALFQLAFLEQIPYDRIMKRMNIRSEVLRVRIHRLRKKLKKMLPQLFGE